MVDAEVRMDWRGICTVARPVCRVTALLGKREAWPGLLEPQQYVENIHGHVSAGSKAPVEVG